MNLEAIAQSTRIASHYLAAIEAEEFEKLPGGVYNTSYIRQYARAIGYNEIALLDQYRASIGDTGDGDGQEVMLSAEIQVRRGRTRLGSALELLRRHPGAKVRHPA
jgi:cytoskeletal protein RodZ